MLTSLPPPPQVEDDDPRGAGGTEEVFEAEVYQVWQLARLFSFTFYAENLFTLYFFNVEGEHNRKYDFSLFLL